MFIILIIFLQISLQAGKQDIRALYPSIWEEIKDDSHFLEPSKNIKVKRSLLKIREDSLILCKKTKHKKNSEK
jgi:hypothetical protein